MKTPEGYEKDDIDKHLEKIGAYVVKTTTFGYGKSGHSDRIVCIDGRFIVIEVKRFGKKPTLKQEKRMLEVKQAGGVAFWGTAAKVIFELEEWRGKQIVSFA